MQVLYKVEPLGFWASLLDLVMIPVMILASGAWREAPQQTHFWNNVKLEKSKLPPLHEELMIKVAGSRTASCQYRFGLPLFHIPILGGWRDYVVLRPPSFVGVWYVGWIQGNEVGISRIPLNHESVRVLIGPKDVSFFAVNHNGKQVPIYSIAAGKVGEGGFHSRTSLR